MSDHNMLSIFGRVTRDAEMKYTNGGTAVLSFSIANNRSIPPKDGGEWKNEASFFDVQAWGKLAEQKAPLIIKGKPLLVGGEIRQDRWEQDGQARSKVYIVANTIQAMSAKEGQGEAQRPQDGKTSAAAPANAQKPEAKPADLFKDKPKDDFTDDIPF